MGLLDFECPNCGGNVTCEFEVGERFASLNFRCDGCGEWCDIDVTQDVKRDKRDVMAYFAERASRLAEMGQ